jgi:hypothetical protein
VKRFTRLSAFALVLLLLGSSQSVMGKEKDRVVSFGELEAVKADTARALALDWLK